MENWVVSNSLMTLVFIAAALTVRTVLARYIRSPMRTWTTQQRLRSLNYVKSGTILGLAFVIIYIWGEQIQGFAVSVFAIMFAMVFTIKETLTSINGAVLRWQGHSYEVGDRISIKDYRGDVIDISLLSTTIMEVGKMTNNPQTSGSNNQPTGRKIVFPNSLLVTETVINESYLGHYQIIDFSFALTRKDNWKLADKILHKIVHEECSHFIEHARNKIKHLEKMRSVDLPQIEPKIMVSFAEKEVVRIYVRCPAPSHLKEKMEHIITKRFLDEFFKDELIEEIKEDLKILPEIKIVN
jgi:small-conductance mechanosensitive channel